MLYFEYVLNALLTANLDEACNPDAFIAACRYNPLQCGILHLHHQVHVLEDHGDLVEQCHHGHHAHHDHPIHQIAICPHIVKECHEWDDEGHLHHAHLGDLLLIFANDAPCLDLAVFGCDLSCGKKN